MFWEDEINDKEEKDFCRWFEKWYDEYKEKPRILIPKIEYHDLNIQIHSHEIIIEQEDEFKILDKYGNRSRGIRKKRSKTNPENTTFQDIFKVIVHIVPFLDKDKKEGILVLNERIYQKDVKYSFKRYLIEFQKQFGKLTDEMAICHLINIYIINYDWKNRNNSSEWFITSLESIESDIGLLTFNQLHECLLQNDNGFKFFLKYLKDKDNRDIIDSFDRLPPRWSYDYLFKLRKDYIPTINKVQNNSPSASNIFSQEGEHWRIVFNGKSLPLFNDLDGFHYIQYLLQHPNEEISAIDLYCSIKGQKNTQIKKEENFFKKYNNTYNNVYGESELSINEYSSVIKSLDNKAIKNYKDRIAELVENDLEIAKQTGDEEKMEKIQEEINLLKRQLIESKYDYKKIPDELNKARTNISKRIRKCFNKISKENKALENYLLNTLKLGYKCVYSPVMDNLIDWNF
ncbi:hypothetical protein ACFL50_00665 [Candidatus Latescibacterota bacterium]